jgi:hypothetical protein
MIEATARPGHTIEEIETALDSRDRAIPETGAEPFEIRPRPQHV